MGEEAVKQRMEQVRRQQHQTSVTSVLNNTQARWVSRVERALLPGDNSKNAPQACSCMSPLGVGAWLRKSPEKSWKAICTARPKPT